MMGACRSHPRSHAHVPRSHSRDRPDIRRARRASAGEIATEDIAARLAALSATPKGALTRGDIARYRELMTFTDDFTFMSPFGGAPKRGPLNDAQMTAMGRFFRDGVLKMDLIEAYVSDGLAVLAVVEHYHLTVGGLPAQDWTLRVTLVYRRYGAEWRLAHRHADPSRPSWTSQTQPPWRDKPCGGHVRVSGAGPAPAG